MGVLNYPILNQLDIHEKVVEKTIMGGASAKDNCSASHHNIETTPPKVDNTERLSRMVKETPELSEFK